MRADLRSLGTSVQGLGTAVAALIDQQQAFFTNMQSLTENLARGGGRKRQRAHSVPQALDRDAMDVDEGHENGADADDESNSRSTFVK